MHTLVLVALAVLAQWALASPIQPAPVPHNTLNSPETTTHGIDTIDQNLDYSKRHVESQDATEFGFPHSDWLVIPSQSGSSIKAARDFDVDINSNTDRKGTTTPAVDQYMGGNWGPGPVIVPSSTDGKGTTTPAMNPYVGGNWGLGPAIVPSSTDEKGTTTPAKNRYFGGIWGPGPAIVPSLRPKDLPK